MTVYNQRFEHYQGADIVINFTIYDVDEVTPIDLTSYTLEAFFGREGQGEREDDLNRTEGSGITITDAGNGEGNITITRAESLEMDTGVWVYDLWRTDSGNNYPLSIGSFDLLETARSRSDE